MRTTTRHLRLICAVILMGGSVTMALAQTIVPSTTAPAAEGSALSHPLGGHRTTARSTPATTSSFRDIQWDELVPQNWDPMQDFKAMNLATLNDGDPRTHTLYKRLREAWDQAPVNDAIDGAMVRIPGYLVPLEDSKAGLKEFLLVPYFGACIHSPPPPANQIIHVIPKEAVKGLRAMDTVWVSGQIKAFRQDNAMGVSGYRMQAQAVTPYVEKKAR